MTDVQIEAIRRISHTVIRATSPGETVLVDSNVDLLRRGRQPDEQRGTWAVGFGPADGFVFILPALIAALTTFATEAVKKFGEEFATNVVKRMGSDEERQTSIASVAGRFEAALRERGMDATTAQSTADVLVRTLAEDATLLRRLSGAR
jgi:hypothetical protein